MSKKRLIAINSVLAIIWLGIGIANIVFDAPISKISYCTVWISLIVAHICNAIRNAGS